MSCPTLTFKLTPEALAELEAQGAKQGLHFEGNEGQFTTHGCLIEWSYDKEEQLLVVTCIQKPFLISCTTINNAIEALLTPKGTN